MGRTLQFDGYHPTTRHEAENMVLTSSIPISPSGKYGRGIYFIDGDLNITLGKALLQTAKVNVAIIYGTIVVDEDKVLDITEPYSEGTQIFYRAHKDFIEAIKTKNLEVITERNHIDSLVAEALCNKYGYHLIRASSCVPSAVDNIYYLRSSIPNAIELCVKEPSVVTHISQVPLEYVVI